MKCQREKFQLQRKYAYLNCAYMSPILKKVENAGIKGIKKKRKPFQITGDDFFHETETVRSLFSQLIDNPDINRTVIVPSVSYGIANVTNNLPFTDGKIILAGEQFPSNVYPWLNLKEKGFEVAFVNAPNSSRRGDDWNQELINAIDETTRVVAIGHVHWSDGTLFQLEKIREKLDTVGGLLIIDGTQSIGALPFSVKIIRPDAVICAGYKWLMGPYSIGLAYYGKAFDNGKPIEENWINRVESDDFTGLVNYQDNYREEALRYEVGEHSNFILIPMLHEALKQLLKWQPENIQAYCDELTKNPIEEMLELGFKIDEKHARSSHLFGVRLPESLQMSSLQQSFKKNKVSVSFRGDAIRVSPNVYNDELDMRKLLKAMKEPILAQKK
ncbi:MAG: aminotransferase class V-fold PLP-dependent enzyme [Ekhidna sp.]